MPGRRALAALALAAAGVAAACTQAAVAAEDKLLVTCGSALKLEHTPTRHRLHSQDVAWSQNSQRALVTALDEEQGARSAAGYWTVHCGDPPPPTGGNGTAPGTAAKAATSADVAPGAPIPHGARVRLQSAASRRWLMASADHRSPMTANNEVSGYDADKSGPPEAKAVVWVVEWDGQGAALPPPEEEEGASAADKKKKHKAAAAAAAAAGGKHGFWGGSTVVRLKHAGTGHWLSSYERARFGHPLTGQQEVSTATGRPGSMEQWRAAEGVFLPVERRGGAAADGAAAAGGAKKDEL